MKTQIQSITRQLIIVILFSSSILFSNNSLYAQGDGRGSMPPEDRAKRQTEMMKEALNLTAAQEPKISALNLKYAKKMEEVRAASKDTAVIRKNANALNTQKDVELKKILTPEQFTQYEKIIADLKARRRGGPQKH
ncbi:MAG: hypothetical protein WCL00_08250 [Bacteroidota bacterium]